MMSFNFLSRKFILPGYVFILCTVLSFGQSRVNPFEVKQRLQALPVESTVIQTISDTLLQDTVTEGTPISGDTLSANKSNQIANPFEVDHVPIIKSSIATRTEKLRTQTETTQTSNGFLFWFLLFSCALLAIVINIKSKALGFITKSIYNENMLKLFQREESTKISAYLIILYLIYVINISVFLYLVSAWFGGPRGILILIYIILGVIGVYVLRHLGLKALGIVFSLTKNTELYSFTVMIFNHFTGIILIPINLFLAFGPNGIQESILWIAGIFIGILLMLRTFRGIFIVSDYFTDRIFQIFVYLCAFEIAPVMILIKTIMNIAGK